MMITNVRCYCWVGDELTYCWDGEGGVFVDPDEPTNNCCCDDASEEREPKYNGLNRFGVG